MNKNTSSGFFETLDMFLKQAHSDRLTTKEYPSFFEGLKVKVSFGQGNPAKIPWISFLFDGQKTSKGIYPGYLFFKEFNILILTYGVSEEEKPAVNWLLNNDIESIDSYFSKQGLKASRYGSSYIFRVYDVNQLSSEQIEKDLIDITQEYKKQMMQNSINKSNNSNLVFNISSIITDIKKTNLQYDDILLYRLILSLLTKPFVILSGLSGSGKTQLALTFAKWICEDESQIRFIAVGADWNNREYLLGYPNALNEGSYILPENNALTIIIEAVRNPQKPYFLILDEMNLSYVERYFADFLSAMESDENILLHPDTNEWTNCEIPANIKLPQNLFIIGTINVDETTYMFSPKVLDRANVIEFRISEKEMHTFLSEIKPLDKNAANTSGADMAASFVNLAGNKSFSLNEQKETTTAILIKFFTELKKTGAEFGYRTASEIYRFIAIAKELNTSMTDNELTDAVIIQKLLPKLHGSRKKIQPVLEALWILCLKEDAPDKSINNFLFTEELSAFSKYPLSAAKIISMYKSAGDNGFTSFAEA